MTTGQAVPGRPVPCRGTDASLPRPRGGSLRSGGQSALFAALVVTGLWLWRVPRAEVVLWAHLAGGAVLTAGLVPWLAGHVRSGLAKSRRRLFTQLSWALLALWVALIVSGLALALPAALWWAGRVWFPAGAVTGALSALHFWATWPALAVLIAHLGMRHWNGGRT